MSNPPPPPPLLAGRLPTKRIPTTTNTISTFDLASSSPIKDINCVDWDSTIAVKRSSEGSAGVFFVLTGDGVVVVKGATAIVQQLYATEMSFWLGLKSPKIRMVEYVEREFHTIRENLIRVSSEVDKIKLQKELNRSFFMVMEYVPGKRLDELSRETLEMVLRDDEVLHDIGRILLFDILTNNSDRLPCIWKNEGNLNNVLVVISPDNKPSVHPIDQGIFCIPRFSQKQNFEQYKQEAQYYLHEIYTKIDTSHPNTEKLGTLLSSSCRVSITPATVVEIQKGIKEGLQIASKITKEKLLELKEKMQKLNKHDWEDIWANGIDCIDIEFLYSLVQIMKEIVI